MLRESFKIVLLTSLFSTQFSLNASSMNPDNDPSRQGISTRKQKRGNIDPHLQYQMQGQSLLHQQPRDLTQDPSRPGQPVPPTPVGFDGMKYVSSFQRYVPYKIETEVHNGIVTKNERFDYSWGMVNTTKLSDEDEDLYSTGIQIDFSFVDEGEENKKEQKRMLKANVFKAEYSSDED